MTMTINEATDNLTEAMANWVTAVMTTGDKNCIEVWEAMWGGGCDLQVVCRLRRGNVTLEAYDHTHKCVVWNQEVAPLRPADGFGGPPPLKPQ
jgi:hypothetical protein